MTLSQFYDLPEEEKDKMFCDFINQFDDNEIYLAKVEKRIGGNDETAYEIMSNDCYDFINDAIQREDCKNGVMVDGMTMTIIGSYWYKPNGKFGGTDVVVYNFKKVDLEKIWKKMFC